MSSTLDPDSFSENRKPAAKGHDIRSLGPSDSSDSGSDIAGSENEVEDGESDTDRSGTGERVSVEREAGEETNRDIRADRVVTAREAGLGGGLDQAEEAQLGVTDEELERDMKSDDAPSHDDVISDTAPPARPARRK